jgi:hypothetical protein
LITKSKKANPNPDSATANQHCAVPHCTTNQPVDCDSMRDPTASAASIADDDAA